MFRRREIARGMVAVSVLGRPHNEERGGHSIVLMADATNQRETGPAVDSTETQKFS